MELLVDLGGFVTGMHVGAQYIDCVRGTELIKIDTHTGDITRRARVLEKEGLSRCLCAGGGQIAISDFCELSLFDQDTYAPITRMRLGNDLSTDICALSGDEENVYCSIRNGGLTAIHRAALTRTERTVAESSMWSVLPRQDELLCGTVDGHLIILDKATLDEKRRVRLDTQNIRSLFEHGGTVYAASQSLRLYRVDENTLTVQRAARKAHARMFGIVGLYEGMVITICHPGSEIALWDGQTLEHVRTIPTPLKLSGSAHAEGSTLYLTSRNIPGIGVVRL